MAICPQYFKGLCQKERASFETSPPPLLAARVLVARASYRRLYWKGHPILESSHYRAVCFVLPLALAFGFFVAAQAVSSAMVNTFRFTCFRRIVVHPNQCAQDDFPGGILPPNNRVEA